MPNATLDLITHNWMRTRLAGGSCRRSERGMPWRVVLRYAVELSVRLPSCLASLQPALGVGIYWMVAANKGCRTVRVRAMSYLEGS